MTREEFEEVFNLCAMPIIEDIQNNNPRVQIRSIEMSKQNILIEYNRLNEQYKRSVFPNFETELLDRHKIAACLCGAILREPVFNKQEILELLKSGESVEPWFYYVNELVALITAFRLQAIFIVQSCNADIDVKKMIPREYPIYPEIQNSKRCTLYSMLYNLSQVKDDSQIGLEHFDIYSYAMFFFLMEKYFVNEKKLDIVIEAEPSA